MAPKVAAAVVGIAAALAAGASRMPHGCIGFPVTAEIPKLRESMCLKSSRRCDFVVHDICTLIPRMSLLPFGASDLVEPTVRASTNSGLRTCGGDVGMHTLSRIL